MYIITGITALTTYLLCGHNGHNAIKNNGKENNGYLEYVPPSEACTVSPLYYYTFEEEEF
jgi:hypothetical protein